MREGGTSLRALPHPCSRLQFICLQFCTEKQKTNLTKYGDVSEGVTVGLRGALFEKSH